MSQDKLTMSERDRDALRKREVGLANRVVHVRPLSPEDKLTPEQVQYEHSRIMGEYMDAKAVIKAERDKKLDALRERCPHGNTENEWGSQRWCNDCESEVRERKL